MSSRFDELGLSQPVLEALEDMGYETPTQIQGDAIPPMLKGRDILAQAPTGTGKTAAFGCALAERTQPGKGTQAIVLVPTRELCEQVAREIQRCCKYTGQTVLRVYGGVGYKEQLDGVRDGAEIIVATPGRIIDLIKRGSFRPRRVTTVVLDEADRMLDMGFREDVTWIMQRVPYGSHNMLYSATIPHDVELLADEICRNPVQFHVERLEDTHKRDEYVVEIGRKNKPWALHRILETEEPGLAFIFCRTKVMTRKLAALLRKHGYESDELHGDMNQAARERVMDKVRKGKVRIVVATDVLARGIDVRHCDLVINYDPPEEPEDYIHRVGRTARMGDVGKAITLATSGDSRTIVEIEGHAGAQLKRMEVPETDSRDKITRIKDWEELADPLGMVHFRIEGLPAKARRMDLFWDLIKATRVREDDLGNIRMDDGAAIVQVPWKLAGRFKDTVQKKRILGERVKVEAAAVAE